MTRAWLHRGYLTYVTGVSRRTHALKARILVDTSAVIATRTALTKVHLDLASSAHEVKRAVAEEIARKAQTSSAV